MHTGSLAVPKRMQIMDMPCNCPECGELVELNDMFRVGERFGTDVKMVCRDCYYELEEEEDEEWS